MPRSLFDESYAFGEIAESVIGKYLRSKGHSVLPVYQVEYDTGKGPRLFLPDDGKLVAPDMLVISNKAGHLAVWIEAKHKTGWVHFRLKDELRTGIDKKHFEDYCMVDDMTPWPVWLLFLQRGGVGLNVPIGTPTGLFGNSISELRGKVKGGEFPEDPPKVYWTREDLIHLATLEELGIKSLAQEAA